MSKTLLISREEAVSVALYKSKQLQGRGKLAAALVELDRVATEVGCRELINHTVLCKKIVGLCNKLAHGKHTKYLRRADEVLQRWKDESSLAYRRLAVLTLNSWAVYHRQQGHLHTAMKYLIRALKFRFDSNKPDLLEMQARTQLNVATLNYDLEKYTASVVFCTQALHSLQKQKELRDQASDSRKHRNRAKKMQKTLCWTYLNLGLAEKELGNKQKAIDAFTRAASEAENPLEEATSLLRICEESLDLAKAMPDDQPNQLRPISASSYKRHLTLMHAKLDPVSQASPPLEDLQRLPSLVEIPQTKSEVSLPLSSQGEDMDEHKYYSPERLSRLKELMDSKSKKFISADLYFFRKLTKHFQVDDDVKHIKNADTTLTESNAEEQRSIFQLRSKRHPPKLETQLRGPELVNLRLDTLRREASAAAKKSEIQHISRSNTIKRRDSLLSKRISSAKSFTSPGIHSKKTFAIAKEEIESLMEEISQSFKCKRNSKPRRSWLLKTKTTEGSLAMSSAKLII